MVDYSSYVLFIILILLICLSAIFSATETALSTLNIIRIKNKAKRRDKRAKIIYDLSKKYSESLTTVLIFNNIVNTASAAIGTYIFTNWFGQAGIVYATFIMTVLILLFGEITPKVIAKEHAERFIMFVAVPLAFLVNFTKPVAFLVLKIENIFKSKKKKVTATESELLDIVQTIEFEGVLNQDERELIESAIEFDDKRLRDIMKLKEDVVFIYDTATEEEIRTIIREHKYSRIPVVNKEYEQVVGILHEADVVDILLSNQEIKVKEIMKSALYISHSRRLPLALEKIQKSRAHMAIVVNNLENKEFLGIATLEDILEELVGEIYDEYDELPENIIEIGLHSYEVDPNISVLEFFDDYLEDVKPPKIKVRTFNGWLKELKGEEIKQNDEFLYENIQIKVTHCENGVIHKLFIEQLSKSEEI